MSRLARTPMRWPAGKRMPRAPRLTIFGRSLALISAELLANAICWAVAAVLFSGPQTKTAAHSSTLFSFALLSWTIGLRHALDADHISAIDNATRALIGLGQLPVTCGFFFSLGHSTIVIVVVVAISISTSIYDKLSRVGSVGAVVGAAISGSFLFLVGLANSILLWRIVKKRRNGRRRAEAGGPEMPGEENGSHANQMLMMKILGPIMTFVDRPWKMYPVGVLFGFGFDTASSVALLAISAIAKRDADGKAIPTAYIIVLPFLFTAGMTLIDSLDSILMLYSYTGFPEQGWSIFVRSEKSIDVKTSFDIDQEEAAAISTTENLRIQGTTSSAPGISQHAETTAGDVVDGSKSLQIGEERRSGFESVILPRTSSEKVSSEMRVKQNLMSELSIALTLMSILVAFGISLITIMALIGDNCRSCRDVAEADEGRGGGLAGKWWRCWATANAHSGFIGAAIVGIFIVVVVGWHGGKWCVMKYKAGRPT